MRPGAACAEGRHLHLRAACACRPPFFWATPSPCFPPPLSRPRTWPAATPPPPTIGPATPRRTWSVSIVVVAAALHRRLLLKCRPRCNPLSADGNLACTRAHRVRRAGQGRWLLAVRYPHAVQTNTLVHGVGACRGAPAYHPADTLHKPASDHRSGLRPTEGRLRSPLAARGCGTGRHRIPRATAGRRDGFGRRCLPRSPPDGGMGCGKGERRAVRRRVAALGWRSSRERGQACWEDGAHPTPLLQSREVPQRTNPNSTEWPAQPF